MRYLQVLLLLVVSLTLLPRVSQAGDTDSSDSTPRVVVEYFYQPGCKECELIKECVLPSLEERYSGFYTLKRYDISNTDNFVRLMGYQEALKVTGNEPVSMVINGRVALDGYDKIKSGLLDTVDQCLAEGTTAPVPPLEQPKDRQQLLDKRSEKMTLTAVIVAGLVDGINPCVFSTLVFFISLLSVAKVAGRKLLLAGSVYCLSCFLSYFAMGVGAFALLKQSAGYPTAQLVINIIMVAVLAVFALLSFRDAWKYKTTGQASSVLLQLPDGIKNKIHQVMRKGLHYRYLIPGAFFIGLIVTVLESVCTGQVYVPTLVLLLKQGDNAVKWLSLLLLYNLMFVIPLLLIFVAAYKGVKTQRLIEWSKKDVVRGKILMGVLFVALAVLLVIL